MCHSLEILFKIDWKIYFNGKCYIYISAMRCAVIFTRMWSLWRRDASSVLVCDSQLNSLRKIYLIVFNLLLLYWNMTSLFLLNFFFWTRDKLCRYRKLDDSFNLSMNKFIRGEHVGISIRIGISSVNLKNIYEI